MNPPALINRAWRIKLERLSKSLCFINHGNMELARDYIDK